jgi:hypothetical protein
MTYAVCIYQKEGILLTEYFFYTESLARRFFAFCRTNAAFPQGMLLLKAKLSLHEEYLLDVHLPYSEFRDGRFQ